MAGPPKNNVTNTKRVADSAMADAASSAARVSALPSRLEPRAGQVADGTDPISPVRRTGLIGRLTYCLAWLVTLSLVVVVFMRVFDHDGINFFTWLNAFTRYVYLPAYACLAW